MKRDMDLIRDILIVFEKSEKERLSLSKIIIDGKSKNEIEYHVELMKEANFLDHEIVRPTYSGGYVSRTSIDFGLRPTMRGYDFLETVRDPEIWAQTKDTAKKAGTGAIELVWGIAKEIAKAEIKRRTGFDVG